MGSEIRVGDIMKKDVISIEETAPVTEVAKLMKSHDVGSIVVAKNEKAEGIITEKDIIHKIVAEGADASKINAEKVMSSPLKVVRPATKLEEAASMMRKHGLKRFPVVGEDNRLVGMISEGDIMGVFPSIVDLLEERAEAGLV
ncbi:CBS domain-containing protein [Candidatus Micrarchaeota archaeon]|nr:CBS domain-containing protein [Candidatus Micrarchaeota archaeon]